MSPSRTIYFMALVGALAGLLCWGVVVWVPEFFIWPQEQFWLIDLINLACLGGLLGGMTVGFSDHWSGDSVVARWVATGTLMGVLFGALAALTAALCSREWFPLSGWQARVLTWTLAGSLVGLGIGLRWWSVNRLRSLHAWIGGGIGGLLGGLLFASIGSQAADLSQALGFVLTGTGIALGVNVAPQLMSHGMLQFVRSQDIRTEKKYAAQGKSWALQEGDQFIIGSLGADKSATLYAHEVQIFLPDERVAPRHAIVIAQKGRF